MAEYNNQSIDIDLEDMFNNFDAHRGSYGWRYCTLNDCGRCPTMEDFRQ